MNNRRRGKSAERSVAKAFGGKRVGVLGSEDVSHPLWSIEVKSRKKFIAAGWMKQAVRNCPQDKTPMLVVHLMNQDHSEDLVCMRRKDFISWFGNVEGK